MATGKAKKKDKLRHAEYYDFQAIQDKLYADSNKGKVFKHLVEIIALPENIRLAYRNIKKNHGSTTPGTDGKTITELSALSDEQLICHAPGGLSRNSDSMADRRGTGEATLPLRCLAAATPL